MQYNSLEYSKLPMYSKVLLFWTKSAYLYLGCVPPKMPTYPGVKCTILTVPGIWFYESAAMPKNILPIPAEAKHVMCHRGVRCRCHSTSPLFYRLPVYLTNPIFYLYTSLQYKYRIPILVPVDCVLSSGFFLGIWIFERPKSYLRSQRGRIL
jgi:hypothetical protein